MGRDRTTGLPVRGNGRAWTLCGVALCAVALMSFTGTKAYAGDDDDKPSIERRVLNSVLEGLGVDTKPGIDYRERSPLVVPPKLELPPPEDATAIEKTNPAWPVDADVKRRRQAATKEYDAKDYDWDAEGKPINPAELNRAGGPRSSSPSEPASDDPAGRPLSPTELGFKGLQDLGRTIGIGSKEERATFKKEPPRASLTDPPVGYRTPSSAQPYGIGTVAAPKNTNTIEHHGEVNN